MYLPKFPLLVLLPLLIVGTATFAGDDISWQTPAIVGYGRIVNLDATALRPEHDRVYKAVFDISDAATSTDDVNGQLEHVARAINLFVAAGVPIDHLRIAAVIHGAATPIVLREQASQKKTGHANPNLKLLEALRAAGASIYVCGQSAAANGIETADMSPTVTPTLSAITDLIVLQNDGYRLVPN